MSSATATLLEKNKAISRQLFDDFNQHDLERLGKNHSSKYVFHFAGMPQMDWQGHRQMIEMFYQAFPDFRLTIDDMIAEGDKVTVRFTAAGTHKGTFQGIPPTGKKVTDDGIAIQRFSEGKLTEEWLIVDSIGLVQQLGAIPSQR